MTQASEPFTWEGVLLATKGTDVRAVVITGASTGIGEACALRMDRLGWRVFAGVRREADGERLKQQASDRLSPVLVDVTEHASVASAAETVGAAVGEAGLAGLVNNAGIGVGGPLEFLPLDELRRQLEVNVVGQIAVTQTFLPLIRKARGRIVNMGSISGKMASPFTGPYGASKFAMEALTDSLRMELRPWGISVSIVEPGSIATPIWDKARASADEVERALPQEAHEHYDSAVAAMLKAVDQFAARGIPADAVARAVAHALASRRPRTRYVVGFDATVQRLLAALVPDRLRDWLVVWQLGLPRKA